jgi:hypothetical protein
MVENAWPRITIAPKWKHLWAALLGIGGYFCFAILGMWIGMTGGLVLQEIGLIRRWGKGFGLPVDCLLLAGGVLAFGGWVYLLWRLRRLVVFTAKLCWYVPKAILICLGGELSVVQGVAIVACGLGVWWGLLLGLDPPRYWPEPWWIRALELVMVYSLGVAATAAVGLVSKAAMRLLGVRDWRASLERALEGAELAAPQAR